MTPEMYPGWFQGFNLAFQIIFFFITLSISWTAYHVFKFFEKEEQKYLSLGWAIIALSYLFGFVSAAAHIFGDSLAVSMLYASAYSFLLGVLILLFGYLRIHDIKIRAILVLFAFAFMVIFSRPVYAMQDALFHLVIAALMFFIVWQMAQRYKSTCQWGAFCVNMGFVFLTLGQLLMAFALFNEWFVVSATAVTLMGYIIIISRRVKIKK